jgi:hypothetical protein
MNHKAVLLPPLHTLVEGRAGLPAVSSSVGSAKEEALAKAGERRFRPGSWAGVLILGQSLLKNSVSGPAEKSRRKKSRALSQNLLFHSTQMRQ